MNIKRIFSLARLFAPVVVLFLFGSAVRSHAETFGVTVNLAQKHEPISPYIYGQFIEHLGRCIYGGIWSEMLEDRKFYYPVTGEAPAWTMIRPGPSSFQGEGHAYELLTRSPWMIVGDKQNVTMTGEKAFVGEHSPRIRLPGDGQQGGLQQERLALIEGKEYIGRIVLAGKTSGAPIEVSLVWGGGASERHTEIIKEVGGDYTTYPLHFKAGGSTDNGRLEIVSGGKGELLIGTVSLMPADNIRGWRADTVALLKQLNAPVYRWPGGNFVSGYDWQDGLGDPDRRAPRKNPAWKGIEHNDVGVHEFMDLCRLINTEAFIAVNTGLGGAQAAAEQIEYVNGGIDTPMGKLRAENGHPAPYGVKWWAIGNEMYGSWQLGHMKLEEYVKKHNRVVDAMRQVDPSFHPIAVGNKGRWSEQMLTHCADHMDLISEHLYWADKDDVVSHVTQIADQIRQVAEAHRGYRKTIKSLKDKNIRIAMDEWNYWYGPNEYGELGTQYFLQDGLGIAVGLHEFFRNSDIYFMANYAQTVNVIGCIKTTKTDAEFETTGLVLKLYRERFGTVPLQIDGTFQPLDVSAALTPEGTELTIAAVNPTEQQQTVKFTVQGGQLPAVGSRWTLTGSDKWSHNTPGKPRQVDVVESMLSGDTSQLLIPPLSVTLVRYPLER